MVHQRAATIFYGLDFGPDIWRGDSPWASRHGATQSRAISMALVACLTVLASSSRRWLVLSDGRATGIAYDNPPAGKAGLPAGLDERFFADLDAGLDEWCARARCRHPCRPVIWCCSIITRSSLHGISHDVWRNRSPAICLDARLPEGHAWILCRRITGRARRPVRARHHTILDSAL